MAYPRSIWQQNDPELRRVVNAGARASSAQVRELERLNRSLDRTVAYARYEEVAGVRPETRRPERRFRDLTRGEASALIIAYRGAS